MCVWTWSELNLFQRIGLIPDGQTSQTEKLDVDFLMQQSIQHAKDIVDALQPILWGIQSLRNM